MARLAGRNIGWVWDNGTSHENATCLSIYGSSDELKLAASYLLTYALRWPDEDLAINALNKRVRFNEELRQVCLSIGTQLMGTPAICEESEPVANCGCLSITDRMVGNDYITARKQEYDMHKSQYGIDGIATLAPNMIYDEVAGNDEAINRALCVGIRAILNSIVVSAKQIKNMDSNQQKDLMSNVAAALGGLGTAAGAAIGAGGAAAAVVSFFGGWPLVIGLALATVGLGIAGVINQTDTAVLDDAQALEDLFCEMFNNMNSQTLTYTVFANSIDILNLSTSNAIALAGVVTPYLQDINVYLQFVQQMSDIQNIPEFIQLPEWCGCEEQIASVVLETTFNKANLIYHGENGLGQAVYDVINEYTGHYATFGVTSKDSVPFYINSLTILDSVNGQEYVTYGNGTYQPPSGAVGLAFPTTHIGFYRFDAGNTVRMAVSTTPNT